MLITWAASHNACSLFSDADIGVKMILIHDCERSGDSLVKYRLIFSWVRLSRGAFMPEVQGGMEYGLRQFRLMYLVREPLNLVQGFAWIMS